MTGPGTARFGCRTMYGTLRRVLVKRPRDAFRDAALIDGQWNDLAFTGPPDLAKAESEFDRFLGILEEAGVEPLFLPADDGTGLDSIYTHDPVLVGPRGAIALRMGKAARRNEPAAAARFLESAGLPLVGAISGEGTVEGGDVTWVAERTVAVGEGYRTNAEGIRQLRTILGDSVDEVLAVSLPHWNGPRECLHLMSLLSPLDRDLLVVYPRLLPVPFLARLRDRGFGLVEVPDDEFETMGPNVLALGPRRCLVVEGNPRTRARLERMEVDVVSFPGEEICLKGSGGPTCLTRPILRD